MGGDGEGFGGGTGLVCVEVADLVCDLLALGKVEDPNQIAFLFPSLKSVMVERIRDRLQACGARTCATRLLMPLRKIVLPKAGMNDERSGRAAARSRRQGRTSLLAPAPDFVRGVAGRGGVACCWG